MRQQKRNRRKAQKSTCFFFPHFFFVLFCFKPRLNHTSQSSTQEENPIAKIEKQLLDLEKKITHVQDRIDSKEAQIAVIQKQQEELGDPSDNEAPGKINKRAQLQESKNELREDKRMLMEQQNKLMDQQSKLIDERKWLRENSTVTPSQQREDSSKNKILF